MNRLVFQVLVGPPKPLWQKCVTAMASYCHRHGLEHRVLTEPVLRIRPENSHRSSEAVERLGYLPIYEKQNALALLPDYDQIAVIDADVWPRPDAGNLFEAVSPDTDFAACVEREMPITPAYARKLDGYARGQYGDAHFPFFNMGLMVFNRSMARHLHGDSPRQFLARPEFTDYVNGVGHFRWSTDQTLMNVWVRSCGALLQHLPARWNALYGAITSLDDAQLVHFFLSDHIHGDDPETLLRVNGRPRV